MNKDLKERILQMKAKLKRGDMARIVERLEPMGVKYYDVYNIVNGKSLIDQQKLILVMKEVKRCIKENEQYMKEFEINIEE